MHGIGVISEFSLLLHRCSWGLPHLITGAIPLRLITDRITTVVLLGIGSRDTGRAGGLPLVGSELGFRVTGNTILDDR